MHCEALQIFTRGMRGEQGDRIRGGALGLGLMVGCATFAYALSKGCKKAEILAIKDDGAHQPAAMLLLPANSKHQRALTSGLSMLCTCFAAQGSVQSACIVDTDLQQPHI